MAGPGRIEEVSEDDLARHLPITGYLDRVSARPGDRLAAKVSVQGTGTFTADVIRIHCADPNPDGPGLVYDPVEIDMPPEYPARHQAIDRGSYAAMPVSPVYGADGQVFSVLVQPWLLREVPAVLATAQTETGMGWCLMLSASGLKLTLSDTSGKALQISQTAELRLRQWVHVWAGWDARAGRVVLGHRVWPDGPARVQTLEDSFGALPDDLRLTLAARLVNGCSGNHFNGRLESPALLAGWPADTPPDPEQASAGQLAAWWDFSREIDTQAVVDRGPSALSGRLVNVPTRAVRGARWSGQAMDWQTAPHAYAALHFHEDDLHDCGWDTDFYLPIPSDLQSGIYGLRLRHQDSEDILPFYIRPPAQGPQARVCVLASTFTHQAYANHARGNCDAAFRARMQAWGAPPNADDYPVYGRSTYNLHPDGSGHAMSSRLRPTLTIRPGYLTFDDPHGSGLRHFPADSHLHYWLHRRGIAFDVVTDEDLDAEGAAALDGYAVLITGSHPEYHTPRTLDAITGFRAAGGHLMYLGGNGFYWRIAHSPSLPGLIELRRAEGGIRAWAAEPGEAYHQLDGGYGGLWRRNGRPPQSIAGVGFSAQGLFTGGYYRRTEASYADTVSWIFDGIDEERLGDYGVSGGGAAGFELDRADTTLGTPETAIVLARSEGHDDSFVTVPEELLSHLHTVNGEAPGDLVRADILYDPPGAGGALFATGSITFCGSLNHRDGENGISRMTENVLRRFLQE